MNAFHKPLLEAKSLRGQISVHSQVMSKSVFLVFGYGVPKDIFQDENYRTYLGVVFNMIFDLVRAKDGEVSVVFCGGHTDFFKPYSRTEAQEMKRYFEFLLRRPLLQNYGRRFYLFVEDQSLSTLENMIFARDILRKNKLNPQRLFIFGEKTRKRRISILSKKIFSMPVKVFPVDFDMGESRYWDPSFIKKKENVEIRASLWAMKNSENMKRHHEFFVEKFRLLREAALEDREKVLKEFWKRLQNFQDF